MADINNMERIRRLLKVAVARLVTNSWMTIAGLLGVLVAGLSTGAGMWGVLAAALLIVAAAVFAPQPRRSQLRAARAAAADGGRLDSLSAQRLAAAVGDPLIIFDETTTAVYVNDAVRATFGPIAPGLSLLMKFRMPEMQSALERVRSGASVVEAVDYVERVPVERVYKVTISAIGGGTGLFVVVFKDQSEARRIDRMRADFIANASHELRTPLASISGFVETLRGPARNDAAARDHFLQIMQNQTQRMARLIDDLLSLSRLEMKPYLPPGTNVDVGQIVRSVVDSLSPLAKESGVYIEHAFSDVPFEAWGDRDELFQVFENLLENACKYGQSGGRVVVSVARIDQPEPEIAVTIRDFGPGIAQEHIPRVTERFYRVDDNGRAQKGTGLGLAIVKHILTRHKARLTIKSTVGEGAEFTVYLPVGSAN